MASLKMRNLEFVKLDKFDGTNFTHCQDKILFLFTALKDSYLLNPDLPPITEPKDDDTEEVKAEFKAERKKRTENELLCKGNSLNKLSDCFYDFFTFVKSPKEI